MARIAFLGLGRMGSGMAARLLTAGHEVHAFNRSPERAAALAALGATVHATAREAARGAEAVFSMTADDESSRAIWTGDTGALAARLEPSTLVIECSTISHAWVMELAAAATALGLSFIDAPVTGLPDAAAAGKLTLLVGAREDDLNRARPILAAVSQAILHFGPVGTGTAYKLIINLMGAVQIAAAAEGLAIAERAGLDVATVGAAIESSQAASPQVVRHTRRIVEDNHDRDVAFTPALRLKDVEYALRLTRELGIGSPFGEVARDAFRHLCDLGYGHLNESKIIETARARSQS